MPDPTLDDLINPDDEDGVFTFLLTQLFSLGFPTTAWQSGGRLYTSVKTFAHSMADALTSIGAVARGGLLALSEKGWLTLLAREAFETERYLETFAEGYITINVAAGAGPYTISVSQLILAEAITGLRFTSSNTTSVTLPGGPSSTLVPFKADSPGAAYNVAVGASSTFITPLPGVTATFVDNGSGTWLTVYGTDDETDDALRIRCRTKWATIGLQRTEDAYIYLAMNTPDVGTPATKVYIDDSNPRGPGTVDMWVASNAGPLPAADLALVSAYLLSLASITADLEVNNATGVPVPIAATVVFRGAFVTALADIATRLQILVESKNIGGLIYLSEVLEEIMVVPGVVNVQIPTLLINGVAADFQLGVDEVATYGTLTITPVSI